MHVTMFLFCLTVYLSISACFRALSTALLVKKRLLAYLTV